ncbi:ankyrin repeat-containing domain protein [Neocallimastix lanati (nom. inval.)]|nr:ankyrin repeat-containing domain protein [Neocallimastix sp. JGI-2020a]
MEEGCLSEKQLKLSVLIENCINFNVLLFNEVKVKHINLEKENIKKIKNDIVKNNRNCLNNLIHYESSLMSSNVIDLVLECYREIQIVFIKVLNSHNLLFIQSAIENTKIFYQLPNTIQRDYILNLIYYRYKKGVTTISKEDEKKIKKYNSEINYLFEYYHFCKLMLIYAYQWSVENKELDMAKKICKYKEIVKSVAFLNACEKNDKTLIRKYLNDERVNINIINKVGKTPLDMAILKFNQELIDLFLAQNKLDINYRGLGGNTSLMTAVECGNYEAMESLLNHKNIDINITNDYGGTALMYATSNAVDNKRNVHMLVSKPDINLNLKDENEETALLLSIKYKNIKIADYLVKQKLIDVNTKNIFGDCPLLLAIEYPNMHPLVNTLLQREDIEVNIQNKNLSTPLMLAIQNNYEDIVKKLLAHPKIDINLKDSDGESALTISLKRGYFYLSRLLIQHPKISKTERDHFFSCLSSLSSPSTISNSINPSTLPLLSNILGTSKTSTLIKYWFDCRSLKDFNLEAWLDNYSEEKTKKVFQSIFKQEQTVYEIASSTKQSTNSMNPLKKNIKVNINENPSTTSNQNHSTKKDHKNIIKNEKNDDIIISKIEQMTSNLSVRTCTLDQLRNLKLKIKNFIKEETLNTQNSYGFSMLMILVSINDKENLEKILSYPYLNMNLQDRYGETALIKAVSSDNVELVQILLTKHQPFQSKSSEASTSIKETDNSKQLLHLDSQIFDTLETISKEINIYRNRKEHQIKSFVDTSLKDSSGYNAKKIAYIYDNKEIENLIDTYDQIIINNKNL